MNGIIKGKAFYRNVIIIAVPIVLQALINIGVNLTDNIMMGSFGETQLSAIALATQFNMLFHIIGMGIGSGAGVLTAQYWGKQDISSIKKVLALAIKIELASILIFSILSGFFPGKVFGVYTHEVGVIDAGIRYFSVYCYIYLFHGLALVTTMVLRTVGIVKLSLYASMASFGLNIFFNWVFIFGKFGAPRLEIGGAAIGTLIARVVEFSIIFGYLLFKDKKLKLRIKDFFVRTGDMVRRYLHISAPVIVSDLFLAVGTNLIAVILGHISEEMVAANAITVVTVQFSTVFVMGLANASAVIVGNTVGRGEFDLAMRQGNTLFWLSVIVGTIACGFILLIHPLIISFYNITEHTQMIAAQLLKTISFIVIFRASGSVITKGVLRGGGDTKFLMLGDTLFLWIAAVPLGYLSAFVWHMPAWVIYACLNIDQIIKTIWCYVRMRQKKWIKSIDSIH